MRQGTPRTRHLRHRRFERTDRQKTLRAFLADKAAELAETAEAYTFTADVATNLLTLSAEGPRMAEGPYIVSTTGTLPAPLVAGQYYWAAPDASDADKVRLSTLRRGVIIGPLVEIETAGSGTHTIKKATDEKAIFKILKANHPRLVAGASDIDDLK